MLKAAIIVGMAACLAWTAIGRAHAGVIVTDGRDGATVGEWHGSYEEPPIDPDYVQASARCHRLAHPAAVAECMLDVNASFTRVR